MTNEAKITRIIFRSFLSFAVILPGVASPDEAVKGLWCRGLSLHFILLPLRKTFATCDRAELTETEDVPFPFRRLLRFWLSDCFGAEEEVVVPHGSIVEELQRDVGVALRLLQAPSSLLYSSFPVPAVSTPDDEDGSTGIFFCSGSLR